MKTAQQQLRELEQHLAELPAGEASSYRHFNQARIEQLTADAERERRALRALYGGPLAVQADAAAVAPAPDPARWGTAEEMSEERRARRAALSPLLAAADAMAVKQANERRGR